jgi:hypothetical protein
VTAVRNAAPVSSTPRAESSGLVIIRAWAEPGGTGGAADSLRSRITLARPLEQLPEETLTVAGLDAGLAVVRGFLTEVAEAARSRAG